MPFLSVPDAAEIIIQGTLQGQAIANVIGAQHVGAYTQTDLDNLSNAVDGWVGSDYLPLVANSVTYDQTHVRGLNSIVDLESVDGTNTGPGTQSGSSMPANASFVITMRTGHTGRSARGRFYWWPFASSVALSAQTVTTAFASAAEVAIGNLLAAISTAGWTPVVISRRSNGAPRLVGVTTPITLAVARNNEIDSQRHRLLRGH
jgi:hypothetical protein